MTTIFLDERGHTGADLLSVDQPVFVIASLNLEEEQCAALRARFFGRVKASELKHTSLAKRDSQREMVLNFLRYLASNQDIAKIGIVHKKFALVCKIVDLVVEPAAHLRGIDLYDRGFNLALSHMLWYVLPVLTDEAFFSTMLSRFQKMVRVPTIENYKVFFNLVSETHQKNSEVHELLDYVLGITLAPPSYLLSVLGDHALDLAFASAINHMGSWRAQIPGSIQLIHDQSARMSSQKTIWDALTDSTLPPAEIGYDRRRMVFPVAVERTNFERSHTWAGLQLADILAGATARFASWLTRGSPDNDLYAAECGTILGEFSPSPKLWPFQEFTPEELGTVGDNAADPNDYVAAVIRRVDAENDRAAQI